MTRAAIPPPRRGCTSCPAAASSSTPRACATSRPRLDRLSARALGFAEIEALAPRCRFADCRHLREPDCAVRAAVGQRCSARAATRAIGACGVCMSACASAPRGDCRRRSAARSQPPQRQRLAPGQRVRQRAAVDVLELPADRHAVRDAAGAPRRARAPARKRKCAVASPSTVGLVARITSRTPPPSSSASSSRTPSCIGSDAVERREVAHQHEVVAAIAAGLLDRHHVGRRLDHAQREASRCGLPQIAHSAPSVSMRQRPQRPTRSSACIQRLGERARGRPALLQQMKRHALRALGTDAGQRAQRLDQGRQSGRVLHRRPACGALRTAASRPAATTGRPSPPTSSPASRSRPDARHR